MKPARWAFLIALACALLAYGTAPAATPDPLSYDDPGMHFRPPDGWERLPVDQVPSDPQGPRAVAAYVFKKNKQDQRYMILLVEPYSGTLDGFEKSHEGELRNGADGTFIDRHESLRLSNGMPAIWLRVTARSGTFQSTRLNEFLVYDLTRGIILRYQGRAGDFRDDEARAAMTSLYVVVYPKNRP
jgi:hypothetical protein